jgi:hypothetical protein
MVTAVKNTNLTQYSLIVYSCFEDGHFYRLQDRTGNNDSKENFTTRTPNLRWLPPRGYVIITWRLQVTLLPRRHLARRQLTVPCRAVPCRCSQRQRFLATPCGPLPAMLNLFH